MEARRIACGRDPRDPDARMVSDVARLLVFRLQAEGFALELTDAGCVRVTPGQDVSAADRAVLTAHFHEIRDLLREERVS